MEDTRAIISMQNNTATLGIIKAGGAISLFRLNEGGINPLSFRVRQDTSETKEITKDSKGVNKAREQSTPANDGNAEAYFEGHFICLPRWGDPSPGEKKAGLHKHGAFSRLPWNVYQSGNQIHMQATSSREGITLNRTLTLDPEQACFEVKETVINFHAPGCLYDLVQHPTLAAPFLTADTLVDCNATTGFDNNRDSHDKKVFFEWPHMKNTEGATVDLRCPRLPCTGVYSFIVDPLHACGWITAYAPKHQLLIGYIWQRKDYPWINMWLHYEDGSLLYRGLEFGTTGIHMPFQDILELNLVQLLNEKTCLYLDGGAADSRRYCCFLQKTPPGYKGVQQVEINDTQFMIREKGTAAVIYIPHSFNLQ